MGLFEGEGSICMAQKDGKIICRSVCMNMTDLDVMQRFYDAVDGVGYLRGPYERYGNKPCYTWSVASWQEIKPLLARMIPWLGERRTEQARIMLENPPLTLEARIAARAENKCKKGHELTEDNIFLRKRAGKEPLKECLTCKRQAARDGHARRRSAAA